VGEEFLQGNQERGAVFVFEYLLWCQEDIGLDDLESLGCTVGSRLKDREYRGKKGQNVG
jgi:hypothetical protein